MTEGEDVGVSIGDHTYVIHVEWPYSWRQDVVFKSDGNMGPIRTIADAMKEAARWKTSHNNRDDSTVVSIYEEVLRLT